MPASSMTAVLCVTQNRNVCTCAGRASTFTARKDRQIGDFFHKAALATVLGADDNNLGRHPFVQGGRQQISQGIEKLEDAAKAANVWHLKFWLGRLEGGGRVLLHHDLGRRIALIVVVAHMLLGGRFLRPAFMQGSQFIVHPKHCRGAKCTKKKMGLGYLHQLTCHWCQWPSLQRAQTSSHTLASSRRRASNSKNHQNISWQVKPKSSGSSGLELCSTYDRISL
jgi:hypothetical protein